MIANEATYQKRSHEVDIDSNMPLYVVSFDVILSLEEMELSH